MGSLFPAALYCNACSFIVVGCRCPFWTAAGIVLLVARFSSSPPFGLYIVQKAVLHKAHFFTERTFIVIICATPVGATNLALYKKWARCTPPAQGRAPTEREWVPDRSDGRPGECAREDRSHDERRVPHNS